MRFLNARHGSGRVLAFILLTAILTGACSGSATLAPVTGPVGSTAPQTSSGTSNAPSSAAAATPLAPATINLWLGGILTTATSGSPYDQWLQHIITRFKAANPGSDVKITLLPPDNGQLAAQVQAAFASKKVPDVMMLYSGAYTTTYQDGLLPLNTFVNATPGFYDSMNVWDISCANFDCQNGAGTILGVPVDSLLFVQWYRKDVLAKAGITAPATTWSDMIAQCDKLVAAGLTPWVYGDRDGYTTSNMMTTEITSFFQPGDLQKVLAGTIKYTDPKFVDAFNAINELNTHHCVSPSSSTREQLDAANDIVTGKVAYMEGQPQFLPSFSSIRSDIGVSLIPYAGTGPITGNATNSGDNWVIPKDSAHPDLAWSFIKLASDVQAETEEITLLGSPPANKAAAANIQDPIVSYIAKQTLSDGMPILDSVMPNAAALVWYRELQQAFAGKISIQDALAAVQQAQDQAAP
ncbi:MAG TPA: extracellular solute-binding protein [Candidatus Limnocylindrales bacterium]|jgi:raffinose/stachyose/melibiose transport system substrate-binding protein